jgi:hypothetical protein
MTNRGHVVPPIRFPLVGWVYLEALRPEGVTVRWRRGDPVAYVLEGRRICDHSTASVIGTIPVLPAGWTDLAQIRELGNRWVRDLRNHRGAPTARSRC